MTFRRELKTARKKDVTFTFLLRWVIYGGFLCLWELNGAYGWIDPGLTGIPSKFLVQAWEWVAEGFIFPHILITLEEAVLGFIFGVFLGMVTGFIFAFWEKVHQIFEPFMAFLNSMPRIVLSPLFVLWFGLGVTSKIALIISLIFFVIFFNTYSGIKEVDRNIVHHAKLLGASRRDLIRHVYLPSAWAWIFSSLRVSIGFAVVGAIMGEYMGSMKGIGYVILSAQSFYQMDKIMAGLLILLILVLIVDFGFRWAEKRYSYWKIV